MTFHTQEVKGQFLFETVVIVYIFFIHANIVRTSISISPRTTRITFYEHYMSLDRLVHRCIQAQGGNSSLNPAGLNLSVLF